MILADSSAWIEFLRGTGSSTALGVRRGLADGDLATCGPVRMELLAGAGGEAALKSLRGLLAVPATIPTLPQDFEEAALLYRACRRRGETVRKMIDCLIAAHAIRAGMPVLHADADFDVLARHTALELATTA